MNTTSRIISGVLSMILGAVLIMIPFFSNDGEVFWIWTYGIPIFIIGIFILFNKKEDDIEKIKAR